MTDYEQLTDDELVDWIIESAERVAEIAALVGAREPVPACPPWTMRQLVAHVISGLSGWYTYNLTHGNRPTDLAGAWDAQPPLPRGNAERLRYLPRVTADFEALIESLDLDAPCYVFQHRRTGRGWLLRAATECAVHVQDAEAILADPPPFSAERAATSIDETLRYMWRGALLIGGDPQGEQVPDIPLTLRVADLSLAWQVTKQPDDFHVEHVHIDGPPSALSVTGNHRDVIPWLFGRISDGKPSFTGDPQLIRAWNLSART